MNSRAKFLIISIALFALAGSALFFFNPTSSTTPVNLIPIAPTETAGHLKPDPTVYSSNSNRIQSTIAEGVPALKPHLDTATSSPVFAEADITQYVATHPVGVKIQYTSPVTVAKIKYLTMKEVHSILGSGGTNLPDSEPMCYVLVTGSFSMTSPPPDAVTVTYQKAYELFDAITGNQVQDGLLN
jgi:hypothetical protein